MRNVIIDLSCLLTFIVTGGFIHINQKKEQEEIVTPKQLPSEFLTESMPYFIPHPMVGFLPLN